MGWRLLSSFLSPVTNVASSEPTGWDGDVLNIDVVLLIIQCSEPTGRDGDAMLTLMLVPVAHVFRAHWVGWRPKGERLFFPKESGVPSPLGGMETKEQALRL